MKKILIIEDDQIMLKNIAMVLEHEGFKTYTAENGNDGIKMCMNILPDLIICDIVMPGKDGYEVCEIMQKLQLTKTIPFIFLTGKMNPIDIRKGMSIGADDYIVKPFDIEDLILSVRKRLEKKESFCKENKENIEKILQNSQAAGFICRKGKFIYANDDLISLFKCKKELITQKKLENFLKNGKSVNIIAIKQLEKLRNGIIESVCLEIVIDNNEDNINAYLFATMIMYDNEMCVVVNIVEKNQNIQHQSKEDKEVFEILTLREKEILRFICEGKTTKEIANTLNISINTVKTHKNNLMLKTSSKNSLDLMNFAFRINFAD